ncbi:RIO1 family-domain-containing protein [Tricharina praecox]|uniref:RIO1 family-domain-containing protein n=1 Tax=Tricharina praecox TaxID=43433 RepID=UPI00221F0B15|nr:RIO1 family-domain-containing protein [Tricharina praecox]KAI5859038.1 RIO1 family-domain-containing protein [Tricharina praecox]
MASAIAPAEPAYTFDSTKGYVDATVPGEHRDPALEFADDDEYVDDIFSEDDDADAFADAEDAPVSGGGGGGDLTKRYNRQREAAAGINKGVNSAVQKKARQTDQMTQLSKFAGRIRLDDMGPAAGGGGGGGGKDKSDRATSEQVLDPRTRMILLQLINRGHISTINGVISTGKEANVYHALAEAERHIAIKVYKTAILVFKDRDRYVTGEHRFRHGYSKSNHRSMVKLWAEKELRNLKRLHMAGLPCPEPLHLRLHVLVMEFLGDKKGWPAPRLRDAGIQGEEEWDRCYLEMLSIMWRMYQVCKLVHADLSEYNVLYHRNHLWVIDVSQSVELNHPRTFEFLRMDIKNVTDFFRRSGVEPVGMRKLFEFITETPIEESIQKDPEAILEILRTLTRGGESEEEEEVFRQSFIPRTLEDVYDYERDAEMVGRGEGQGLVYNQLLAPKAEKEGSDEEEVELTDDSDDDEEDDSEETEEQREKRFEKTPKGKKHEDKNEKKEHKMKVKEDKREQRKTKMPKHLKKRLISSAKGKAK